MLFKFIVRRFDVHCIRFNGRFYEGNVKNVNFMKNVYDAINKHSLNI